MNEFDNLKMDQIDTDLWQGPDTVQLIELINNLKTSNDSDIFNNNNELYIEVANKLFEYGHSRTYSQCKRKWKELVETYNEYKKTGEGDPPAHYEDLDKVLSNTYNDDPSNEPVNQYGPVWSQYETNFLIKVMKVGNFLNKLKTDDPLAVYEQIAEYMHKIGPIIRNREDIQQRWQNLKQSYIKYIKGDLMHFKYFELMDALLDWEPNSIAFEEDQFKDGHEYGDEAYQNPDDFESKSIASAKRALNWTHKETESLLEVLQKHNIKQIKRENIAAVFDAASLHLRLQGFKRSSEQCRVKFKHLKVKYFDTVRKKLGGNKNPERFFYHYVRMKDIMHADGSCPSEMDADSSDFGQDSEHYEVEYLEDNLDEGEAFEKIFLKEQPDPNSYSPSSYSSSRRQRKGRQIWSQTETQHLLNLLKAKQVKKYSRRAFFEDIAHEMAKAGYNRTAHTCMIKWKNLRNQLYTSVRNMAEGTEDQCPFYDEIRVIVVNNGQTDSLMFDAEQQEFDESEDPFDPDDTIDQKFNGVLEPNKLYGDDERNRQSTDDIILEKKRRRLTVDEEETDHEMQQTKRIKSCEMNTVDDSSLYVCNYKMDDTEHYCISLAPTIKRLPRDKQAKLKIQIQKLLYDAEFDSDF